MAAQPQPIYPNEFNSALDRLGVRLINLFDARIDGLTMQMRVDREESIKRDNELLASIRAVADSVIAVSQRVSNVETRLSNVETRLTNLEASQAATVQLIRDLHAEAMEGINELRKAVNELKQKGSE